MKTIINYRIWALHGFAGLPADWDWLRLRYSIETPRIRSAPTLTLWAQEFNRSIIQEGSHTRNIIMGYSMGGRLALHAVLNRPTLWEGAILISAHPGLKGGHNTRLEQDEMWARRFEQESWNSLISDWNAQPSLKAFPVTREEANHDRSTLASQMRNFSLATQERIHGIPIPHVWLVGSEDKKLIEATDDCSSRKIISGSHRLLWENPQAISQEVDTFLKERFALL